MANDIRLYEIANRLFNLRMYSDKNNYRLKRIKDELRDYLREVPEGHIRCKLCKTDNPDKNNYCGNCGLKLKTSTKIKLKE